MSDTVFPLSAAQQQLVLAALDAIASATKIDTPQLHVQSRQAWIDALEPDKNAVLNAQTATLLQRCDRTGTVARIQETAAVLLPTKAIGAAVLTWKSAQQLDSSVVGCISWFGTLIDSAATMSDADRDRHRWQRVLKLCSRWIDVRDITVLLDQIARSAAELMLADRASIFLYDRRPRQLVGYPALGVTEKPLRVAADAGVVGAVWNDGQARRWQQNDPQDEVNRAVDIASGYKTTSLLAVPLVDAKSKKLGVFEVLNAQSGSFSVADEQLLVQLATLAAAAIGASQHIQSLASGRNTVMNQQTQNSQLIGSSPAATRLQTQLEEVATTDLPVLLLGENGTGKEVAARQIHLSSDRASHAFIAVNCAALTETLLESELFGHERGAFTDAVESRVGKFELASGGTILLDEIGDMSLNGQAKLLRVLEDRTLMRVGGSETISVNVRIIAATNQNLPAMIDQQLFREDLFYRLCVVPIQMPPLRDRLIDLPALIDYFMHEFCEAIQRDVPTFTNAAMNKLKAHNWPGNIRELRNLIQRLAALHRGDVIDQDDIILIARGNKHQDSQLPNFVNKNLSTATDDMQTIIIEQHIAATGGNMTAAAESLGLQRSNLYRKMKQLGMKNE